MGLFSHRPGDLNWYQVVATKAGAHQARPAHLRPIPDFLVVLVWPRGGFFIPGRGWSPRAPGYALPRGDVLSQIPQKSTIEATGLVQHGLWGKEKTMEQNRAMQIMAQGRV
jgi:hypothetical protein